MMASLINQNGFRRVQLVRAAVSFLWILAAPLFAQSRPADTTTMPAGVQPIEIVCVDEQATSYATFQSHNQKVVSNPMGIFLAYLRTRNEPYTAQQWRLVRSIDGGRTFKTLHEATDATNPPVLETNEKGDIFLARPDFVSGDSYFYRFSASTGYADPAVTKIPGSAAGKYSMLYDQPRACLYYFAHNNTFHIVDPDGTVRRSYTLLQQGKDACLQYPSLSLDQDGTLYAAWTTQKLDKYMYWDIHVMKSADGGQSWRTLGGELLTPPIVCDQSGPTDRITLDDEFDAHTWLSNFMVKDGKLHFVYLAQTTPSRQHYVRYDLHSGKKDIDVYPGIKGETLTLAGLDGFFAARAAQPKGPLYCVLGSAGHIACLVSRDDGQSWHDHAVSKEKFSPYSITGCREIADDGYIIGAFVDQIPPKKQEYKYHAKVYFFKIKATPAPPAVRSTNHIRRIGQKDT